MARRGMARLAAQAEEAARKLRREIGWIIVTPLSGPFGPIASGKCCAGHSSNYAVRSPSGGRKAGSGVATSCDLGRTTGYCADVTRITGIGDKGPLLAGAPKQTTTQAKPPDTPCPLSELPCIGASVAALIVMIGWCSIAAPAVCGTSMARVSAAASANRQAAEIAARKALGVTI